MTQRLHYLDSLRSFCMLFGIFVHSNTFFINRPMPIASEASSYFRMATFFLISGFLVAMVGQRIGAKELIRRRSVALLVPLVVVLCLINPPTNWLIVLRHDGYLPFWEYLTGGWRVPTNGPGAWLLHLWFLVSLFAYVCLYPAMSWLADRRTLSAAATWLAKQPAELAVLALALLSASSVLGMRIVFELTVKPSDPDSHFFWVLMASFSFSPYFVFGVILNRYRALFEKLHHIGWAVLAVALLIGFVEATLRPGLSDSAQTASKLFARHFMTGALVPALLLGFRYLGNQENRVVTVLTRSMYTIYLLHFLLIFLIGFSLAPFISQDIVLYFSICGLTILIGLIIHERLVSRIPLLTFLLNGKRQKSAATKGAVNS